MVKFGIKTTFTFTKTQIKNLILNNKVSHFLFEQLIQKGRKKDFHFVWMLDNNHYEEINENLIQRELDNGNFDNPKIAILADNPEYPGCPFEVEPERGDWKVVTLALWDLMFVGADNIPYFASHPNEFDFEEMDDVDSDVKVSDVKYIWC